MPGYREEAGVAPDSMTETYVAAKLYVDNWRWADTPFYVRAGKRLPRRETTIAIQFQRAPHPPFAEIAGEGLRPNVLLIHVQPDEGVSLAIGAKVPGAGMIDPHRAHGLPLRRRVPDGLPEAYERLILDAMLGDATLFTRADEVDEQWALVDAIVAALEARPAEVPELRGRDLGPAAADELIHRDGRAGGGTDAGRRRPGREAARPSCACTTTEGTRTSVMTHVAWAPPKWAAAARRTLAGLEELHPSRTILLFPNREAADADRRRRRAELLHDPGPSARSARR